MKGTNPPLSSVLDYNNLQRRMAEGYISVSNSGTHSIYCYTKSAQFEQIWDHETKTCRGLIVHNATQHVVGRPFRKFFNFGQVPLPHWTKKAPVTLYEKMDGSLGICFWNGHEWQIATKGSFTSDQAVHANDLLKNAIDIKDGNELGGIGTTTLFEIIYPENRIVVDYGKSDYLCYLACIENSTGSNLYIAPPPFHKARTIWVANRQPDNIENLAKSPRFDAQEGVVAVWALQGHAFRMKFKNGRYLRLHSLMTKMTARKIWEILKTEGYPTLVNFVSEAPDEFQEWAISKADDLLKSHATICQDVRQEFLVIVKVLGLSFGGLEISKEDRKTFAKYLDSNCPHGYRGMLFKLLDGKSIDESVWKVLYPRHETPFMEPTDE